MKTEITFDLPPSTDEAFSFGFNAGRLGIGAGLDVDIITTPQEGIAFLMGFNCSSLMTLIEARLDGPQNEPLTPGRRYALLVSHLHELTRHINKAMNDLITPADTQVN